MKYDEKYSKLSYYTYLFPYRYKTILTANNLFILFYSREGPINYSQILSTLYC
jgi:hypothetical protein